MRDDIAKVGLPASARRYARLTSKDKAAYGPAKVDLFVKAQGDLSHQSTKGFPRSHGGHSLGKAVKGAKGGFPDISGTGGVPHAMKEAAERIVSTLLEANVEGIYGRGQCHAFTMALARRNPRGEIFGLFDRRFPDEIVHSAFRLPDSEVLMDAFGKHTGREAWEAVKHNFDQAENLEWRPMSEDRLWRLVQGDRSRSVRRAGKYARQVE